ncbi:MAG TPA: ABC transporter permease [Bryobacteraceae bacterium]|nr:ABC transporter permease [Bryobacteraceae bacterium]
MDHDVQSAIVRDNAMQFVQDFRFAVRVLKKSPGFTIMAVSILALGIGANTAIFSVVNSILLTPLPYPHADRLVVLWENNKRLGVERDGPSGPNYLDWKAMNQSFDDMALLENGTGTLTGGGEPEQFPGARVTPNFLDLMGAKTFRGRTFSTADGEGAARHNVAVLTYGFWTRRFGSDPKVIGRMVTINHEPYTVIGVLSENFWSPVRTDAYVPWPEGELRARHRDWRDFGVIARMKPGVTLKQAHQDMDSVAARIAQQHPGEQGWGVTIVPFQDAVFEYIRPALLLLLASVGFVLLLACANVGNLLLARITARQREIGIRSAMGASQPRIMRQFLTENLSLSLMGGALGFLVAGWTVDLLVRWMPATIPLPNAATEIVVPHIAVDGKVLLYTVAVSFLCAVLFGLFPALSASRADLNSVLKDGGRASTGSAGNQRIRRLLVISETALAFLLLMGAGLMLRSFDNIQHVNPGMRTDHVMTFHVRLPTDTLYQKRAEQAEFYRKVIANVQEIPNVRSAGGISVLPMSQEADRWSFRIEGKPANELMADFRRVSPDFFEAMGVPLLQGRTFTGHDDEPSRRVAIVDTPFVQRYFPDRNPIGQRLLLDSGKTEIVGVVTGVHHYGLDQPARPTIYAPFQQVPSPRMTLVVNSSLDERTLVTAVKHAVWAVDKEQPVFLVRSMDEYVSLANSAPRIALWLLGAFAVLAILLAALGIYSVVSYTVSQRTQEFGVRIALGATPSQVKMAIVRQGLVTTAIGIAAGFVGVLLLTPALRAFLYGVGTVDFSVLICTAVFLTAVAVVANYIPAVRATRVDPMTALRCE